MRTDAELLASYAANRDEAAFAELARRHGPMVYRVCLRLLGDHHGAEDSAQAVFVMLSRKARSLRPDIDLAAWLHGTARNAAHWAVRSETRRARREEEAAVVQAERYPEMSGGAPELSGEIDRALAELPAPQRQAVILRYVEGRTQEEAAELSGCPQGTLARRATMGLEHLRERLSRRRAGLSSAAILAWLAADLPSAVPETLLPSLLAASKLAAVGAAAGTAGAGGLAIAEGVAKMMFWAKVKVVAATVAAAAFVGAAAPATYVAIRAAETKPVAGSPVAGKVAPDAGRRTDDQGSTARAKPSGAAEATLDHKLNRIVDMNFEYTELGAAMADLSKQSGVEIRVDPGVAKRRISCQARGVTLRNALDAAAALPGILDWRLEGKAVLWDPESDPLDRIRVSFNAVFQPLHEILSVISRESGVKIVLNPDAAWKQRQINLRVTELPVGLACEWVARLAGYHCFVNSPSSSQREIYVGEAPPEGLVYRQVYQMAVPDSEIPSWRAHQYSCLARVFGSREYVKLAGAVKAQVLPGSWGGQCTTEAHGGGLTVYQTQEGHAALAQFLAPLQTEVARKARALAIEEIGKVLEADRIQLEPKLLAKIDVNISRLPFEEAVAALQKRTQVVLDIDESALTRGGGGGGATVTYPDGSQKAFSIPKDPRWKFPVTLVQRDVAIGDALDGILKQVGLKRMYLNGTVFISTEARLRDWAPENSVGFQPTSQPRQSKPNRPAQPPKATFGPADVF